MIRTSDSDDCRARDAFAATQAEVKKLPEACDS